MNDNKSIIRNSVIISSFVLVGKVLGFIKQSIQAWAFGTTALTDTYISAESYMSLIGSILCSSIIPVIITHYISVKHEKGEEDARKLVKTCLALFACISIFIMLLNYIFAEQIASFLGNTYTPEQIQLLIKYLRMLLPVILFGSIIGVCSGYLQGEKNFWPTQLLSLLMSTSIITCIILLKDRVGINSIIYGFVTAYILYCINLLINSRKIFFTHGFVRIRSKEIKQLLRSIVPLIISFSVVDLGHLADRVIAATLESGSVTYLYYGQVICCDLVNAVIVNSLTTVLLPSLSEKAVKGEIAEVTNTIQKSILTIWFAIGLITILYIIEGHDLIETFFEHGIFNSQSTDNVNFVSIGYALGLPFIAACSILTRAHYALHDTLRPMIISTLGIIINVILSYTLSKIMGLMGISVATSISYVAIFIALSFTIKLTLNEHVIRRNNTRDIFKIIFEMIASFVVGLLSHYFLSGIPALIRLFVVSSIIVASYLYISYCINDESYKYLENLVLSKFKIKRKI